MSSNLSRIAIGLSTAIGLAISVPGQATVYVADFPQTTIDRYTDTFDPLPLTPGNGAIFSGPGLVRPVAVAYGTGTLYWQSYFDGKVETVNLVTGVSSVFIPGVAVNREALGLAVVGNTLYEMIHSTGKVLEFNATTGSPLLILDALTGTGNDHGGLYVAPNGNIFVASYTTNIPTSSVVTELAPNGTLLNKFTSAEGLSFPIGLAVGPDGKLYVGNSGLNTNTNANPGSGFVEVFDLTDGTHTSFLSGLPDTLTAVAFTPDGKLLLGSKFTPTYVLCDPTVAMCGPVKSVVSPVSPTGVESPSAHAVRWETNHKGPAAAGYVSISDGRGSDGRNRGDRLACGAMRMRRPRSRGRAAVPVGYAGAVHGRSPYSDT